MLSRLFILFLLLLSSLDAQINLSRQTVYTITTVAALPVTGRTGQPYLVQDSADGGCTVGGGALKVQCIWSGSAWVAYGGTGGAGSGTVDSVNGATGVVVLDAGDIGVTPVGGVVATDAQAAIAELDSEKLPTGGTAAAASALATDPVDCVGGLLAVAIAANGDLTCVSNVVSATSTIFTITEGPSQSGNLFEVRGSALDPWFFVAADANPYAAGDYRWYSSTLFTGAITHANTANRAWNFPDVDGTVALIATAPAAAQISGSLAAGYNIVANSVGPAEIDETASYDFSSGGMVLPSGTTISATGFTNAQHAHAGASSGGQIAYSALTGTPTIYNQTIEDEGTPLTQRSVLGFTGAGVSCADTAGETVCTVSGGGGGGFFVDQGAYADPTGIESVNIGITGAEGDGKLQVVGDDVAQKVLLLNAPSGQTDAIADFQVNGTSVASILADGTFEFAKTTTTGLTWTLGGASDTGQSTFFSRGGDASGESGGFGAEQYDGTLSYLHPCGTAGKWCPSATSTPGTDPFLTAAGAATVTGIWDMSAAKLEFPNGTATVSADCDAATEAGRLFIDTDATTGQQIYVCEGAAGWVLQSGSGGGLASTDIDTSAELKAIVTDETGSGGALVFATGPTLSAPVISTISNTGTLTLPASTDTLVGRATTDTLTNKTLTSPVINDGTANIDDGTLEIPNSTTLPGTCTVGQVYADTDATSTAQFYICTATNTWTAQGGGSSSYCRSDYFPTMSAKTGLSNYPGPGWIIPAAVTYDSQDVRLYDTNAIELQTHAPPCWGGTTINVKVFFQDFNWGGSGGSISVQFAFQTAGDAAMGSYQTASTISLPIGGNGSGSLWAASVAPAVTTGAADDLMLVKVAFALGSLTGNTFVDIRGLDIEWVP